MNLKISNKDAFFDNFLIPVSKVTENCVLDVTPGKISTLTASADATIVTYSEYRDLSLTESVRLNVPDLKKFTKLLSCIEEEVNLVVDSNNLSYKSPSVRFKYHLYDDGIISRPDVKLEKINNLDYDAQFTITGDNILKLIKGSSLTENNEKIYFSFPGNGLVDAEITDKSKHNTNSYGATISSDYTGTQTSISFPLQFEVMQHISQYRADIYNVRVVTRLGVFIFTAESENVLTKFIVSALKN